MRWGQRTNNLHVEGGMQKRAGLVATSPPLGPLAVVSFTLRLRRPQLGLPRVAARSLRACSPCARSPPQRTYPWVSTQEADTLHAACPPAKNARVHFLAGMGRAWCPARQAQGPLLCVAWRPPFGVPPPVTVGPQGSRPGKSGALNLCSNVGTFGTVGVTGSDPHTRSQPLPQSWRPGEVHRRLHGRWGPMMPKGK